PGGGQGAPWGVKRPLMVAEPRQRAVAHAERSPVESASLKGARIVVVDDDPTAVELIREVLVQAGAEVIECRSADEALQAVVRSRPNAIVSDIEMPGQDGYSLLRKVRGLRPEPGGQTPAVALTALRASRGRTPRPA